MGHYKQNKNTFNKNSNILHTLEDGFQKYKYQNKFKLYRTFT